MPRKSISRRFLFELFMPREARFPDEKFWTKDGEPIEAPPKGPPRGAIGQTHADFGAQDADDPDEMDYRQRDYDPSVEEPPPPPPPEVPAEPEPPAKVADVIQQAKDMGLDVDPGPRGWIVIRNPQTGESMYIPDTKSGSIPSAESTLEPDDHIGSEPRKNGKMRSIVRRPGKHVMRKYLDKLGR